MIKVELKPVEHKIKIGDKCENIPPNIKEDSLFYENGVLVGFYIKAMKGKIKDLAELSNNLLRTKDVPKSVMTRLKFTDEEVDGRRKTDRSVNQYSTILGGVPPKPHMRRPYPSVSSVHGAPKAKNFIKAMLLLVNEAENLIKEIMPEQYEFQLKQMSDVPEKYKFGKLFTSSISNYNIATPFHRDTANIEGCVNVIITKRENSYGGNLHVPDYNATMDSADNSILVYPAWKNVHGVTPIVPTKDGGYRNSLVFYPLRAFKGLDE